MKKGAQLKFPAMGSAALEVLAKKYIHPLEFLCSSAQPYGGKLYSPLAEAGEVHLGNGEYPCISSSHPSLCMLLGF